MPPSDDEYYTVPIKDQRVFGAGLKRKRVPFIPASSTPDPTTNASTPSSTASAAERYLFIVGLSREPERSLSAPPALEVKDLEPAKCDICNQPIQNEERAVPHEASLAHQICLEHSHPPSHIDRQGKGFRMVSAYGWDPDERKGLGASGEGRLYPIQAKEKRDTVGLGVKLKDLKAKGAPKKVEKLNAKQVRKQYQADRKKRQSVQKMFTANDDVLKHLGSLG